MLVCSDVVGAEQKFFSSAEGRIVVVRGDPFSSRRYILSLDEMSR